MTDTPKNDRAKLHSTIWDLANELRGSVDGWDFKQYVLGILFYRFISENLSSYINKQEKEAGNTGFNYASLMDEEAEIARDSILEEKGFFILPTELFENVRKKAEANKTKKTDVEADVEQNEEEAGDNLNETLEKIFKNIEASAQGRESQNNMKGLFYDIDVNSNRLGATVIERNEKILKLLKGIGDLEIENYEGSSHDILGDAYERLMAMYAANAGKSGGEFFTPQKVSELLARIALGDKKELNKVYDPACGSGSLLLQFAKVLKDKERVRNGFFGQELNLTNYNLCRINMFLHDINYAKFDIAHGDTLTNPAVQHWDEEPFEAIVSNPPYSTRWAGDDDPLLIDDERFSPAGILAPKSKADLAFVMHSLAWLATNGTAAIVSFPGAMYRGGAEQKIRKYLVDENYIDAVIQLPTNLFFGTSIATCILVLKKNKSDTETLFINATKEFTPGNSQSKLDDKHISNIFECYKNRKVEEHFSYLATYEEIEKKDYNLSVGAYVEPEDSRTKINITELNADIKEIVARQNELRMEIDAIVADLEGDMHE